MEIMEPIPLVSTTDIIRKKIFLVISFQKPSIKKTN